MLPIQPLKGELRRPDLRNHRKILVVDGRVAFTGSQNLIEPGYNKPKNHKAGREWVELMARVEGPVGARELNVVFATDWYSETGQSWPTELGGADRTRREVEPRSGDPERTGLRHREQPARLHHPALLGAAPALDHQPLLRARRVAAVRRDHRRPARCRGGAVRQRGRRPVHGLPRAALLLRGPAEAGVRIYLYPAPCVLHSKHFSVDDDVAVIGSSNMDTLVVFGASYGSRGRRRRRLRGRQGLLRGERAHRHLRRGGDLTTHRWQGQDRQEARTADPSGTPGAASGSAWPAGR